MIENARFEDLLHRKTHSVRVKVTMLDGGSLLELSERFQVWGWGDKPALWPVLGYQVSRNSTAFENLEAILFNLGGVGGGALRKE